MTDSTDTNPRLTRLTVSNYRSIGENVSIDFEPLTVLVGINGSGKSNLLDAPRFIAHALSNGLNDAIESRDGFRAIQRQTGGRRGAVRIEVALRGDQWEATYSVLIGAARDDDYLVKQERLDVSAAGGRTDFLQKNSKGDVKTTWDGLRSPVRDSRNLALIAVGGDERIAPVVSALRAIETYSLSPDKLRQAPEPGQPGYLSKLGEHWPSTVKALTRRRFALTDLRVALEQVTGDIIDVRTRRSGDGRLYVEFQHAGDDDWTKWLPAARESDGTLRVAGILTALTQHPPLSFIGIEEPEQTVHPGVLSILNDFLVEASSKSTVAVTTHSPDLLDLVQPSALRVVNRFGGITRVGRLDPSQAELVRRQLESPGGLLRSQGLRSEGA